MHENQLRPSPGAGRAGPRAAGLGDHLTSCSTTAGIRMPVSAVWIHSNHALGLSSEAPETSSPWKSFAVWRLKSSGRGNPVSHLQRHQHGRDPDTNTFHGVLPEGHIRPRYSHEGAHRERASLQAGTWPSSSRRKRASLHAGAPFGFISPRVLFGPLSYNPAISLIFEVTWVMLLMGRSPAAGSALCEQTIDLTPKRRAVQPQSQQRR